jgi:PDZ domain-containing secreted protein
VTSPEAPLAPRRRRLTAGRIAGAGLLLLALVVIVSLLVPADGYELLVVDEAHPVAPLVRIQGHEATRSPGSIYFVDVEERRPQLIQRLVPWVRPDGSSLVHSPPISSSLDRRLARAQMADSQRVAPYVALKLLGYKVSARSGGVTILVVQRGAPAAKVLRADDVILGVGDRTIRTIAELRATLAHKQPGDSVTLRFQRRGRTHRARLVTTSDPQEPNRAIIGVTASDDLEVKHPFEIRIDTGQIG